MHDDPAPASTSYFHGARGRRLLRGLTRVIVADFGDDPSPHWPSEDDAVLPGEGAGTLASFANARRG